MTPAVEAAKQEMLREMFQMLIDGAQAYVYDQGNYYLGAYTHSTFFKATMIGIILVVTVFLGFYLVFRIACMFLPRLPCDAILVAVMMPLLFVGGILFVILLI